MGVELVRVKALLDETHPRPQTHRDQNSSVFKKMGGHNMVIAVLCLHQGSSTNGL